LIDIFKQKEMGKKGTKLFKIQGLTNIFWVEIRRAKFAEVCRVTSVKTFCSSNIAKDIAFYAVEKQ